MAKDLKKETQVKGLSVKEVEGLADLKDSKYYPFLKGLLSKLTYDLMWKMSNLIPEDEQLRTKYASDSGKMEIIRKIDKIICSARGDLERMAKE